MAGPSKKMIFGKIFGLITTTSKDLTTITGGGHDDNLVTIMSILIYCSGIPSLLFPDHDVKNQ